MLARLLKAFNWRHQPRCHAVDLVAAVHVVLRMLHHLNSSGADMARGAQCAHAGANAPVCEANLASSAVCQTTVRDCSIEESSIQALLCIQGLI